MGPPRLTIGTIIFGVVALAGILFGVITSGLVAVLAMVGVFAALALTAMLLGRLSEQPFWQAVVLLVVAYVAFKFGIAKVPPLLGVASAPVPQSVLLQYMLTALVGILIYVSDTEESWRRFKAPLQAMLVDSDKRWLRGVLLVLVPALVGWGAFQQVRPQVQIAGQLRSIHPAPPGQIQFHGQTIQLDTLANPLRHTGTLEEHYRDGRRVYYQNCIPCHGDLLDGHGHFAHGFDPAPLAFDKGTIAQLRESFVFWRISKGGPGLPREGTPWNSAMPVWEDFLSEHEIWSVIVFLYEQAGVQPRQLGAAEAGGANE